MIADDPRQWRRAGDAPSPAPEDRVAALARHCAEMKGAAEPSPEDWAWARWRAAETDKLMEWLHEQARASVPSRSGAP